MARFAALDLGSNALRLRIVEGKPPFEEVLNLRAPVRLGADVFSTGKLAPSAIGQTCAALRDFKKAMDAAGVDAYRATATSAVRESQNAATLVERARREAGIELEIIEGVEEARLIQLAVLRRLPIANARCVLIDVGGGSTEFTLMEQGKATASVSLPLGSVRLLEAFLRNKDRVETREKTLLDETVDRALVELGSVFEGATADFLVGTGGNVDTLAELCAGHSPFAGVKSIDVVQMDALSDLMCGLTKEERRTRFSLRPDRADTIVPASRIFSRAAKRFKQSVIVAPGVGLKEGILIELCDKHYKIWNSDEEADGIFAACTRLGRRYHFDEAHALLVATHAAVIFDALADVHLLKPRDRLLLRVASMLHDVGDFIRYDAHHKHSYYIIQHSDIVGLSPAEREVVANVARYHRKGPPSTEHQGFRELDKDARAKVRALASILRVADALDREHLGKVPIIDAKLSNRTLRLTPATVTEHELEAWTVHAKSDFLREFFEIDVELADA